MNRERLFSYLWYPVRREFSHPGWVTFQRLKFLQMGFVGFGRSFQACQPRNVYVEKHEVSR